MTAQTLPQTFAEWKSSEYCHKLEDDSFAFVKFYIYMSEHFPYRKFRIIEDKDGNPDLAPEVDLEYIASRTFTKDDLDELLNLAEDLELELEIALNNYSDDAEDIRTQIKTLYKEIERLMNEDEEPEVEVVKFETVKVAPLYEINTAYPYEIRKKSNSRIIQPYFDESAGYVRINLENSETHKRKQWLLHRVIAFQWIANPDNKTMVDHIDGDHKNYHLENLRWLTPSENSRNVHSNGGVKYDFVDDISLDSILVDEYGAHKIENLFFYEDKFYLWNGEKQYRVLRVCTAKSGVTFVNVRDTNDKTFQLRYTVFKRDYNL
jgi:hypothetical protein